MTHRIFAVWVAGLLSLLALLSAPAAQAQDDPPGRVGRIADVNGSVSWFDGEQGQWTPAERNRPLTGGDRISTAADGRAELRVGSTVLRLSNSSELEVLRLDDERMVFQLHSGSLAARVRAGEVANELEFVTAEARLLPQRAGQYRIDRIDDATYAGTWRGEMRVDDSGSVIIGSGQRFELFRDSRGRQPGALKQALSTLPNDGFAAWVLAEDQRDDSRDVRAAASARYVSAEMTGAEDLDRNGRWEQHPDYGAIWTPAAVQPDWAPYRYGRWAWVQPWGWTWVDDQPWGFAPFHYGRWVYWRNSWCWAPGQYVARPVYAPALVAWVGAPGLNISLRIGGGGPSIGWVPLAPREVFRPIYRHTPVYVDRVNPGPPDRWRHPPRQVPTGPVMYGNQGVPNGVTVVASDVLTRRQPVQRGLIDQRAWRGDRDGLDGRGDRGGRDGRPGDGGRGPQQQPGGRIDGSGTPLVQAVPPAGPPAFAPGGPRGGDRGNPRAGQGSGDPRGDRGDRGDRGADRDRRDGFTGPRAPVQGQPPSPVQQQPQPQQQPQQAQPPRQPQPLVQQPQYPQAPSPAAAPPASNVPAQPGRDRGERGDRGDRGDRGERGERGERGDRGDRGDRTDRGPQRGGAPVAAPAAPAPQPAVQPGPRPQSAPASPAPAPAPSPAAAPPRAPQPAPERAAPPPARGNGEQAPRAPAAALPAEQRARPAVPERVERAERPERRGDDEGRRKENPRENLR